MSHTKELASKGLGNKDLLFYLMEAFDAGCGQAD